MKKLILLLILIAIGALFITKYSEKETAEDKTANLVTEIKEIGEFYSMIYTGDVVVSEEKKSEGLLNKVFSPQKLVTVCHGTVKAGFDLKKVDSIKISSDSLFVILPKVEILETIINPSDMEIFIEEGTWSHTEIQHTSEKAKAKFAQEAVKADILVKADQNGKNQLKSLLDLFGYKTVFIEQSDLQ